MALVRSACACGDMYICVCEDFRGWAVSMYMYMCIYLYVSLCDLCIAYLCIYLCMISVLHVFLSLCTYLYMIYVSVAVLDLHLSVCTCYQSEEQGGRGRGRASLRKEGEMVTAEACKYLPSRHEKLHT